MNLNRKLLVFERAVEPTIVMHSPSSRNTINSNEIKPYWLPNEILQSGERQSTVSYPLV